jgi:hypothetical protein
MRSGSEAGDATGFSLFSLFFPEIISEQHLVSRRNARLPALRGWNNSKTARCFSLFPAVSLA